MIVTGQVVTPDRVVPGHIQVDGDRIVDVGTSDGRDRTAEAGTGDGRDPSAETGTSGEADRILVPGFVDIHCHGGGGHTFTTGDPEAARAAAAFHLRHGTTTLVASLVSASHPVMQAATVAYAPLVGEGVLAGVHFEGPYLAPARCGAHDPALLREPSLAELSELVATGVVRMVTLAPELPGGLDAVRLLAAHSVVAAVGHTDASYAQAQAAVAAGATVATHLFNAMPPVHHRAPGPVVALLAAPEVTCELVADGVHLHHGTLAFAARVASGRVALVTDAIAATGMPDGSYELGGQAVAVAGGVARLATADGSPGPLAGSTLTMDAAFRQAVGAGLSLVDAARAAATNPARVLGLAGTLGALTPGLRADLVELDASLQVTRVLRAGTWVA